MKTSARNVFSGKVHAITSGAVNDEVEITINENASIVASITKKSTEKLGLQPGKDAFALVKAPFVLLMTDADDYLLSTRNQFPGTITELTPGAVNAEVKVDTEAGLPITAIVTMGSVKNLGLAVGKKVTAIFKAMQVIVAVPR